MCAGTRLHEIEHLEVPLTTEIGATIPTSPKLEILKNWPACLGCLHLNSCEPEHSQACDIVRPLSFDVITGIATDFRDIDLTEC